MTDLENLKLYTLPQVAKILGITDRTAWNYVKAKKIKAVKIGGKWKISEDNLREFINGGSN